MKLLQRNIKYNFRKLWWAYVLVALVILIPALDAVSIIKSMHKIGNNTASFTEILLENGFKVTGITFNPKNYSIPFVWLLNHSVVIFPVTYFIWEDHRSNGSSTLIRTGSRKQYFGGMFSTIVFFTVTMGILRLVLISLFYYQAPNAGSHLALSFLLRTFTMFMVEDVFFSLLVIVLSLFTDFRTGFITTFVLILLSTFFPLQFMPGQASMGIRQAELVEGGFKISYELLYLAGYFILLYLAAKFKISRYDFWEKDE